jgi:hypothetical protein
MRTNRICFEMTGSCAATWWACLTLLICPVVCSGERLGQVAALPFDGGDQQPCVKHACLCSGAPIPTRDQATATLADLPVAALPIADLADWASSRLPAYPDAPTPMPDPPAARGVVPLLI